MITRRLIFVGPIILFIYFLFVWSPTTPGNEAPLRTALAVPQPSHEVPQEVPPEEPERPTGPIHKTFEPSPTPNPISDNLPIANGLQSKDQLPAIPEWNRPPNEHVPEGTPLFIGFNRNWPLLQQCVLSYITAGWPPGDIYVVDNTGTMKSNFPPTPRLTLQNPFYLDIPRLTTVFGVNVISTPTLFSFAQLQNFYIFTALEKGWEYYFWSHMDVLALSDERYVDPEGGPFKSLYLRAVATLRETIGPEYRFYGGSGAKSDWAIRFFAYDSFALNNVQSFIKIGGWDTFISHNMTSCDINERFRMAGVKVEGAEAGHILKVGSTIDLNLLFRRQIDGDEPKSAAELQKLPQQPRGGAGYYKLLEAVRAEVDDKANGTESRSSQTKQVGGQGEPFYRTPRGFQEAMEMEIACGVATFKEKWGHDNCELLDAGLKLTDEWMVDHDWEK